MKISEAIKEIIKLRDIAVFDNYKMFIAMLADFSTDTHKKELIVFKNAVDENMLKMCIDDSLENSRKILKLQIQLENKGLSQDWINFIIESFALPLGWNYTPREVTQQVQSQNQQTKQVQTQPSNQSSWTCSCGTVNTTNFCGNCGSAKPLPKSLDWTCVCGTVNTTKFCTTCGKQKGQKQAQQPVQQKQVQQKQVQKPQQIQKVQTQVIPQKQQVEQKQQIKPVQQSVSFKNAKVGDYVKFGNYPQTSSGGVQPIEWQVLARENNKMLVISKYGLEERRFDSSSNNWENSEIRQWLNGEFYNRAFSENEKKLIRNSGISTKVYRGGFLGFGAKEELSYTDDYIFLLSTEEAKKYFVNNEARKCKATEYAVKNGAYVYVADNGYSWWWLRSPNFSHLVYSVDNDGLIDIHFVNRTSGLACHALWINL